VRSRFADVRVTAAGSRATVLVTATLPVSELVCGAVVRASVPGAGPTRLRLELVRSGADVRIASQALVAG
jgi:hypothetical protein